MKLCDYNNQYEDISLNKSVHNNNNNNFSSQKFKHYLSNFLSPAPSTLYHRPLFYTLSFSLFLFTTSAIQFFFFTFSSYQIIYILMFCKTRLFLDWRWRLKIRSLVPRHIFCKSETSNINSTANFLPKIMCSRCFVITEPDA